MKRSERLLQSPLPAEVKKGIHDNFVTFGQKSGEISFRQLELDELCELYVVYARGNQTEVPSLSRVTNMRFDNVTFVGAIPYNGTEFESCTFYACKFDGCAGFETSFVNCRFQFCSFRFADLTGALFESCKFYYAHFFDCKLRDSIWREASGINETQFARSNLKGALLPPNIAEFRVISQVDESAKNSKRFMFVLIVGCLYSLLTLAATSDAALITNSQSLKLPIIQTDVPVLWFYYVAPLILIAVYGYFQIGVHRFWETVASLPAIFPDGQVIDSRLYPWLFSGLTRSYFDCLRRLRSPFHAPQILIVSFLSWLLMPLTILFILYTALIAHSTLLTILHAVSLSSAVILALWSFYACRMTLKHGITREFGFQLDSINDRLQRQGMGILGRIVFDCRSVWNSLKELVVVALLSIVLAVPIVWISLKSFDQRNCDLTDVNLKGVSLSRRDLRGALFSRSSLIGTDITKSDLSGADLSFAQIDSLIADTTNLSHSRLVFARGQYCKFRHSILDSADLSGAKLKYSDFSGSSMNGVNIGQADLSGANLSSLGLDHFNFSNSLLDATDFSNSSLVSSIFKGASGNNTSFSSTILDNSDFSAAAFTGANFENSSITNADFRKANITGSNFSNAELSGVDFTETYLNGCRWDGCNLQDLDFSVAVESYGQEIKSA